MRTTITCVPNYTLQLDQDSLPSLKEFFFKTFTVLYFESYLLVSYTSIPSVPFNYKLHLTQSCLVNILK